MKTCDRVIPLIAFTKAVDKTRPITRYKKNTKRTEKDMVWSDVPE